MKEITVRQIVAFIFGMVVLGTVNAQPTPSPTPSPVQRFLPEPAPTLNPIEDVPIYIGGLAITMPATYGISDRQGSIIGLPFFAKLQGLNDPDFYLVSIQGPNSVDDMAKQFFAENFQGKFTLEESRTLSGSPRKVVMIITGLENTYGAYFIPLQEQGTYLVGLVPLPEEQRSEFIATADKIMSSAIYHGN